MHPKRANLLRRPFQFKIMLVAILCTMIAVFATTFVMSNVITEASDALSFEFLTRLVRQVSMNVDENIQQIESIIVYTQMDPTFQIIMDAAKEGAQDVSYKNVRLMEQMLLRTQLSRDDIKGFYVFDAKDRAYYCSSAPSLKSDYRLRDEAWYDTIADHNGPLLIATYKPERYLIDQTPVVSVCQYLRDMNSREKYGTIVVDIKTDMFGSIVQTLDFSPSCNLLLVTEDNDTVYQSYREDDEAEEAIKREIIQRIPWNEQDGTLLLEHDGHRFVVTYSYSKLTGWRTICWADIDAITGILSSINRNLLILALLVIMITTCSVVLLISRRFKSLNQLNQGLHEIQAGHYEIDIPTGGARDEIGILCDSFNKMAARLNYLINTVEKLNAEKQEDALRVSRAELYALQAQINPHLIYNTLDTISMMAEINNDDETRMMSTALGKLIRISVKGESIVSVSEELEHVKSYLVIQKIRFDERFDVSFHIEPDILREQIPKLILQPIIENSIQHGMELLDRKGHIRLEGRREGDYIVLTVQDDGIGIAEHRLEELRLQLNDRNYEEHSASGSIGLQNVNQRIKLNYHDDACGVRIFSQLSKGTQVEIRMLSKRGGSV